MSQLLSLGAINKLTGEYVYPKIANKIDKYFCPECGKDLILCQGDIRTHHFRHKSDSTNPCHHYSNPCESQIHKDAKLLLKTLLEKKIPISFIRSCVYCKKNEEYEIPETSETSVVKMEYRFEFNGPKVADVAYIDNDEIVCIFEICNTHTTSSENRPEPWFEIDAETLIRTANDNKLSSLQIPCIRNEKCEECIEIENSDLKVHNWFTDWYDNNQETTKKNTRHLIRSLDRDKFIFLNVTFSQKDIIKKMGGKWNKEHKLWYVSYDTYKKYEKKLIMYRVWWECKDCEDLKKQGEEDSCSACWKEAVGWMDWI
jgi:hypothetical protein